MFESRSRVILNGVIVHPNQFYEESLKVIQGTSQLQSQENKIEKTVVKVYTKVKKDGNTSDGEDDIDFDQILNV